MRRLLLPVLTLWWREVIRFFRQRSRLISAFAQPLVFWLLLGAGLGQSFRPSEAPEATRYFEYLYAGIVVLVLLFTAISQPFRLFTTVGRVSSGCACRTGFKGLNRSRQALGGTTLALLQGCSFSLFSAHSRSELEYRLYRRNSRDNCFTFVRVDKPRLDDCLAYGFAARLSPR